MLVAREGPDAGAPFAAGWAQRNSRGRQSNTAGRDHPCSKRGIEPLDMETSTGSTNASTAKVVVATTVALTFISFWRAAAVVLNDMASTMYYIGGITEQAIGKPAPWMVVMVMLFSFAVRS